VVAHPHAGCAHLFKVSTLIFSSRLFSGGAAPPTEQVDYKNHQCHYHKQVNQASGYVEYKTQQPKNQKYCDNSSQQRHSTSPPK
jgi:hypothetical protein